VPASSQPTPRGRREDYEGTVYQITSGPRAGEWRAQISLPGGKRRGFSGRTEEIVKQKLLDARFRASHGQLAPPRGENFEEYARGWLAMRRHELRYNSRRSYLRNLELHVFPHIGGMALLDIKHRDLQRVQMALLDTGHKPKTVRLVQGIVQLVLAQAEVDELIQSVPRMPKVPKIQRPNFVPLDPSEIQTLLAAMRGDPLEALFLLTLTSALRRGEVCGIRWSDLDLDKATLHLAGQIVREPHGVFVYSPLKSDTGHTLVIDLAPPVIEALLSAFVLPERMPVVDDERQMPLFPGDEGGDDSPHDRLLFHVIKMQAEGLRLMAEVNRLQHAELQRNGQAQAETSTDRHGYGPANINHRTWRGFVLDMQRLEGIVRRDNQLEAHDIVSKEMIFAAGGPLPKTTTRTMKGYGLPARRWPPSLWDANEDRPWHSPG
jgi:Phage integrase, N-terminal SAM-like domain